MEHADIVVLGASGFIGQETVRAAAAAGFRVVAVARRATTFSDPRIQSLVANADTPRDWIAAARGARAVIDLVQPALDGTGRITRAALRRAAEYRASLARTICDALDAIPADDRPAYLSVSGLAELIPDARGVISSASEVSEDPIGFGVIGVAVRDAIAHSRTLKTYVHLGTVYGPGKTFTARVIPKVRAGRFPIVGHGKNHISLVHVVDVASALVQIASMGGAASARRWIVSSSERLTQGEFVRLTASELRAPAPRNVPRWLGTIVAGGGLIDEVTKNAPSDASALASAGWQPVYSTYAAGLAATLRALDSSVEHHANAKSARNQYTSSAAVANLSVQ